MGSKPVGGRIEWLQRQRERSSGMQMPSRWIVQMTLAVVTGLLAILTLVWPEWIEEIFGVEPDGGNGALEILIVVGLFIVSLAFSGLGVRSRRRLLAQSARST